MPTVADKREEGGQKSRKFADVLNGWSQSKTTQKLLVELSNREQNTFTASHRIFGTDSLKCLGFQN
jgi:hypothetical protein